MKWNKVFVTYSSISMFICDFWNIMYHFCTYFDTKCFTHFLLFRLYSSFYVAWNLALILIYCDLWPFLSKQKYILEWWKYAEKRKFILNSSLILHLNKPLFTININHEWNWIQGRLSGNTFQVTTLSAAKQLPTSVTKLFEIQTYFDKIYSKKWNSNK